jgi:hypothetical protein
MQNAEEKNGSTYTQNRFFRTISRIGSASSSSIIFQVRLLANFNNWLNNEGLEDGFENVHSVLHYNKMLIRLLACMNKGPCKDKQK